MLRENENSQNGISYEHMRELAQGLVAQGQHDRARIVVETMVKKWPERVLNWPQSPQNNQTKTT